MKKIIYTEKGWIILELISFTTGPSEEPK